MANIKYDLATKITRGDKERWQKIGVVFQGERGPYAIIDAIPVGFTGMVSFFEPKDREQQQAPSKRQSHGDALESDIPF